MGDTITLTGLNGTVSQIRAAGEVAAASLQKDIAEWFEVSRTLLGKVHIPAKSYTEWKAEQGFDTRPGHRSGMLQESLDFDRLYTLKASRGTLSVTFDIELSSVEYAQHYSSLYTRQGNLLAITKKAERTFRDEVVSLLPEAKKKEPKAKKKSKKKAKPKAPKPVGPLGARVQRGRSVTGIGVDIIKRRVAARTPNFGSISLAFGMSISQRIADRQNRVQIQRSV